MISFEKDCILQVIASFKPYYVNKDTRYEKNAMNSALLMKI